MATFYEWQVRSYDEPEGDCIDSEFWHCPKQALAAYKSFVKAGAAHVEIELYYGRGSDCEGLIDWGYADVDLATGTVADEFDDGKSVPAKYRKQAATFKGAA